MFYWNTCPEMPNTGKHYLGNKEWVGNADYTKLGEYKTKERAIEILDEIEKFITTRIINTGTYEENDLLLKSEIVKNQIKVFVMPKE